jgi:uncharacterized protein
MTVDFSQAHWINPPTEYAISADTVKLTTDPHTDFWQRSYYGFRHDNAPALLLTSDENFTLTVQASFVYQNRFDQCGVVVYLDSDNWFKASIEYESQDFSRLGSVVTNLGYSDWATTDIATPNQIWYRLSRRGPDFLVESSPDGVTFQQMRILHLHQLGETSAEMGRLNPPPASEHAVRFGLYACSPLDSRFAATFSDMRLEPCRGMAHG